MHISAVGRESGGLVVPGDGNGRRFGRMGRKKRPRQSPAGAVRVERGRGGVALACLFVAVLLELQREGGIVLFFSTAVRVVALIRACAVSYMFPTCWKFPYDTVLSISRIYRRAASNSRGPVFFFSFFCGMLVRAYALSLFKSFVFLVNIPGFLLP